MPLGHAKNAPIAFQHLMTKVKDLTQINDMVHYIDDILIGENTSEEIFVKTERVFIALRKARLTINPGKCVFCTKRIHLLKDQLTPAMNKTYRKKIFLKNFSFLIIPPLFMAIKRKWPNLHKIRGWAEQIRATRQKVKL